MIAITFTWRNDNPDTISNVLARRLGRQPTRAEEAAEVARILREAREERLVADAEAGRLPHQRK